MRTSQHNTHDAETKLKLNNVHIDDVINGSDYIYINIFDFFCDCCCLFSSDIFHFGRILVDLRSQSIYIYFLLQKYIYFAGRSGTVRFCGLPELQLFFVVSFCETHNFICNKLKKESAGIRIFVDYHL